MRDKPAPAATKRQAVDKSQRRGTKAMAAQTPSPELVAKAPLLPSVNGAAVVSMYAKDFAADSVNITALRNELLADTKEMLAGDMTRAEGMLFGQAHALQSIFTQLSRRAEKQDRLGHWETYLRMALKAQNQCRMTLETLATIKNPPVVFAKQANINNGGQQQVNNGTVSAPVRAGASAHAENSQFTQNKLLGANNGEWLDSGAPRAASGADTAMEPVGAVDRPPHD